MKRARPKSVFVPYERWIGRAVEVKAYDLPRFVEPHQVMKFLLKRPDLASRLLDWREEFDAASIDEYLSGVGETVIEMPQLINLIDKKH